MATPVSRSTQTNNVNTINRLAEGRLVAIVLHSDQFQVGGRCRLYPTPQNAKGKARLKELTSKPEEWCQVELLQCCAQHKSILGFYTTQIDQDRAHRNRWVCFVSDAYIPAGDYVLETPLKGGKRIHQRVRVAAKMFARDPLTGSKLDGSEGSDTLTIDYMVGDGVSLEESLYNLCSYRYEASVGRLREDDMTKVKAGHEPTSGFATFLGVASTTQEMVANTIGIVQFDFPLWNNLKKLDDFLGADSGWFKKPRNALGTKARPHLLALWEKSGLKKAVLNWTKDPSKPNVDGILVAVEDDEGKWKRLSTLGIIEENHLKQYRASLKGNAAFRKFSTGVEAVGGVVEAIGVVSDTAEMLCGFSEAWYAWERMMAELLDASRNTRDLETSGGADAPWKHHGHGFFSRGDLSLLENLKTVADNAASDAQDAGWKWFLKVAPMALGFLECGELFETVKSLGTARKYYGIAKKLGTTVDKFTESNVVDIYQSQIATKWHDMNASIANDSALMHHAIGMSSRFEDLQAIALQFYVRAKVLYGLKRLIDLCGPLDAKGNKQRTLSKYNFIQSWTSPGRSFEAAVAELGVEEYIGKLCLGREFWIRKDQMLADWIQHWMQEKDPAHRGEVLRTEEPKDHRERWFKVDFQRYWPIHYRDIADVQEFAARFSTNFSSVDDSDVETCFLERGEARWTLVPGAKDGSKMLEITRWVLLRDEDVIDSETPVRAVLVFRKGAPVQTGLPVSFQLERTDLINVPGPIYQTVAGPLQTPRSLDTGRMGKDEHLARYKDQLGAVVSFSYSYAWKKKDGEQEPAKIYSGLKPMLEDPDWTDSIASLGFKYRYQLDRNVAARLFASNQTFAVKYKVAGGEAQGYAHTKGRFWNSTVEITLQSNRVHGPVDPEFNARNRAKFTDLEFLHRQLPETPPPPVKYPELDKVLVQRAEGDKWMNVDGERGVAFGQPVRLIFVFESKAPSIPVVARIKRTDGFHLNVPGPYYTSSVVAPLDPLGAEFRGKWGVVITPTFHVMQWFVGGAGKVVGLKLFHKEGEGPVVRGIKPLSASPGCSRGESLTRDSWSGYKFSIYYGIGTNDPEEANEVASIKGSVWNDIPLTALVDRTDSEDVVSLIGHGVYGVSPDDKILYKGRTLRMSTIPLVAIVQNAEDSKRKRYVLGDQMHAFIDEVRGTEDLFDLVSFGY